MNGTFRVITRRAALPAGASLALLLLPSCARVTVDPIEVKPIHIVHDINIRVDRQLDDFFAFQEKLAASTQPAATAPVPQTARTTPNQGVTP
jgi:hypothetical protein